MPDRELLLRIVHRIRARVQKAGHSIATLAKIDQMSNRLGPVLGIWPISRSTFSLIHAYVPSLSFLSSVELRVSRKREKERERERKREKGVRGDRRPDREETIVRASSPLGLCPRLPDSRAIAPRNSQLVTAFVSRDEPIDSHRRRANASRTIVQLLYTRVPSTIALLRPREYTTSSFPLLIQSRILSSSDDSEAPCSISADEQARGISSTSRHSLNPRYS